MNQQPASGKLEQVAMPTEQGSYELLAPDRIRQLPAPAPMRNSGVATISHVADYYTRFPGEELTLFSMVTVRESVPAFSLRVRIPPGMDIDRFQAVGEMWVPSVVSDYDPDAYRLFMAEQGLASSSAMLHFTGKAPIEVAQVSVQEQSIRYVIWHTDEPQPAGRSYQFEVVLVVDPLYTGKSWYSEATLTVGEQVVDRESVEIELLRKSRYLQYLPALYEQDDMMGRFLMLFESFWRPVDQQIDSIHYYFDPDLTPAQFLPWLASWFNLTLDEHWSESQQRRLLRRIIWLYRKRGTKVALQEYLEIFTGYPVDISEHRAKDLRLGATARLGAGVALGKGNVPHTFTVRVRVKAIDTPAGDDPADVMERERKLQRYMRVLETIIETEKPVHTSYTLEVEEAPLPAGRG
jgi:phage tail-like protein